ncbi:MAG TPA: hypothetical protein H9986_00735, partial [Candidatus Prevotella stercoripullorum]|nr:hypothetical protein [Candidatus Prevotella stercoripullorum]
PVMALVVFRDVFIGTLLLICGFFSEAFSDNENSVFEMLSCLRFCAETFSANSKTTIENKRLFIFAKIKTC